MRLRSLRVADERGGADDAGGPAVRGEARGGVLGRERLAEDEPEVDAPPVAGVQEPGRAREAERRERLLARHGAPRVVAAVVDRVLEAPPELPGGGRAGQGR